MDLVETGTAGPGPSVIMLPYGMMKNRGEVIVPPGLKKYNWRKEKDGAGVVTKERRQGISDSEIFKTFFGISLPTSWSLPLCGFGAHSSVLGAAWPKLWSWGCVALALQ